MNFLSRDFLFHRELSSATYGGSWNPMEKNFGSGLIIEHNRNVSREPAHKEENYG